MSDEIKDAVVDLAIQQRELLAALKSKAEKGKDFWDMFSSISTFLSGVIVALVGLYFTSSFNKQQADRDTQVKDQQLRLAQVELVQKFIPQLNGTDREKKLAIIAISSLGNAELATNLAVLDQSEGSMAALESLATSGNTEEKNLAQRALKNSKELPPRVYMTANLTDREYANQIKERLTAAGVLVANVQYVAATARGSKETDVLYYREADKAEAQNIVEVLKGAGQTSARAFIPSGQENSQNVRPNHFDVRLASRTTAPLAPSN